jgi:hypothetical protein
LEPAKGAAIMNKPGALHDSSHFPKRYSPLTSHASNSTFYTQNKRKILKIFLLNRLHQLFLEKFRNEIQTDKTNSSMECYTVDSKIIQFLIQNIIETGEYTLEGIAYHTKVPFDIIFDAACGNSNQLSITPWARIVDIYIQINPEISQLLFDNLIETKSKNHLTISSLLNEL